MWQFVTIIIFSLCVPEIVKSEVFSSTSKMELLLTTQKSVIDILNNALKNENIDHEFLKNHLNRFELEHKKAMENIDKYLGNPINCFRLIKRLTVDLDLIEKMLPEISHLKKNEAETLPSETDLVGAAEGLLRLETMYGLDTTQLASGLWNSSFNNNSATLLENFNSMTISDCYEIGRAMYKLKYYPSGIKWFKEAQKKCNDEQHLYPEDNDITQEDINNQINYGFEAKNDMLKKFEEWYIAIAKETSNIVNFNADLVISSFKNSLKPLEAIEYIEEQSRFHASLDSRSVSYLDMNKTYSALCKGGKSQVNKDMKCHMAHGPHPFLTIAPIKAENLHNDPNLTLFHNVISDAEIKTIKDFIFPKLKRGQVYSVNKASNAWERICQIASAKNNESTIAARIRARVEHFTGMDLTSSEQLQVANYGIGGHFSPHYDYWGKDIYDDETNDAHMGNRVATVVFYMSDVDQGGATVFPRLGIGVFPVKGSALFWTNLLPTGHGDTRTCHASCSVLRGSKWVLTQWISLRGQELRSPCLLDAHLQKLTT